MMTDDDIADRGAAGGRQPSLRYTRLFEVLVRVAFVAGLIAVCTVSLLPSADIPPLGSSDKLMHAFCYAVLAANGALVFRGGWRLLALAVALFGFGAALEGLQALMPDRDSSARDALANGAGILAGLTLIGVLTGVRRALRRGGRGTESSGARAGVAGSAGR